MEAHVKNRQTEVAAAINRVKEGIQCVGFSIIITGLIFMM